MAATVKPDDENTSSHTVTNRTPKSDFSSTDTGNLARYAYDDGTFSPWKVIEDHTCRAGPTAAQRHGTHGYQTIAWPRVSGMR